MMGLEELYREIQPGIYAFFYLKTMDREVAEDLTQEIFYQAVKGFQSYSGQSTIQTWVFAIAKNLWKKHIRSKRYKDRLQDRVRSEEGTAISAEEQYIQKEQSDQLLQKINQLDAHSKEVVTYRVYGELSFREIGLLMGKSENYARVTFHRAKLKLQRGWEGSHG